MSKPTLKILNTEPRDYSTVALALLEEVAEVDSRELKHEELLACIGGYDALIVRLGHCVDEQLIEAGTRLRAIVTATTGLDHIDLDSAHRHGIAVLSLRGEVDFLNEVHATAEHTWALLLALLRRIPWAFSSVLEHNWNRDAYRGNEVQGKTLGIIGYGRLGKKVACYGHAFGMRVVTYDPFVSDLPAFVHPQKRLEDLLRVSDVVSIHIPLSDETKGLIGRRELATMKRNALLLNTSRGAVIDGEALLQALNAGQVGGAALDVLCDEVNLQRGSGHPLVVYASQYDNLIITPHIGGATRESMEKTEVFMAGKLRRFLMSAPRRATKSKVA